MTTKSPILPERLRKVPKQFSWLDHRLVRDRHIEACSHHAAALYLFLVTVGDKMGLSYYGDGSIMKRLSMDQGTLESARENLVRHPYDIAVITPIRASSQFRITLDTNRYSVPAEYAGARLTLKAYPDRLCIYDNDKLVARHVRSYDRRMDMEHPDHPKELLAQRRKARDQKIFMRFLQISKQPQSYYDQLAQRRMNPHHHVRKIVALSEIYGTEAVARAMGDAFALQAFSCEYIANLLEQRSRKLPEPGALHLTRREDLLDITIEQPDINLYDRSLPQSETT